MFKLLFLHTDLLLTRYIILNNSEELVIFNRVGLGLPEQAAVNLVDFLKRLR